MNVQEVFKALRFIGTQNIFPNTCNIVAKIEVQVQQLQKNEINKLKNMWEDFTMNMKDKDKLNFFIQNQIEC